MFYQEAIFLDYTISITNKCNLKCSYCYERHLNTEYGNITEDIKQKIADYINGNNNAHTVYLFGGEPLLYKDIVRFYCENVKAVQFVITTNGTLLDEEFIKWCIERNVILNIFEKIAEDFLKLLAEFDIPAKITTRKNTPIVYIKEYQLICDALALVGANKAVLSLQNEAAIRELRNNINRQNNCLNANLNKTIGASVRQLNAIKIIQENVGLESLNEGLMELALLRLANPEATLEELRKLSTQELTKSGINHRFTKILEMAQKIENDKLKITTL